MHRLFLQFLKEYPELVETARDAVKEFIEEPDTRQVAMLISHTYFN